MHETSLQEHSPPARDKGHHKATAVECADCGLYGLCRVAGLESSSASAIDDLVSRREEVAAGQVLIRSGQPLDELIAVRSGAFTLTARLANDHRQLAGIVLPGELIGLGTFGEGEYPFDVESLGKASICRFSL